MASRSAAIVLSIEERSELERLIRSRSTPQHLAHRARMIVLAADEIGVGESAQRLGVWRKGVSAWRARWLAGGENRSAAERLADAPRSGAPATITAEQTCATPGQARGPRWPANDRKRAGLRSAIGAPAIWRGKLCGAASSAPSRPARWGAF